MTTNRDELLARIERDVLEAVTRGAVKGEIGETTLGSIRHTIREIFSSLPQRSEGAAVADMDDRLEVENLRMELAAIASNEHPKYCLRPRAGDERPLSAFDLRDM